MSLEGEISASIHDLTHDGRGVAEIDGRAVFVAGALPSEQVLIKARRRRRRHQEAELLSIVSPAEDRTHAGCEYFGRCGGCALQHLRYEAQVRFKQKVVVEAFTRIGAVAPREWLDPVVGPQWGYRRRARLGVKHVAAKGRVLVGFRERATSYVTDMQHCPVLVEPMNEAIGELAAVIGETSIKDRLPQVEVAIGDQRGALVLRVLKEPLPADLAALGAFGEQRGLDIYLQRGGPGSIAALTDGCLPLSYELEEFGIRIEFAPTDFIQINAQINARMVAAAVAFAKRGPAGRVLDLYCGLGNFSLPLAGIADELLGIEGEAGLVARAAHNAERNACTGTKFLTADLAEPGWAFLREPWDLVLMDPPRTGAESVVREIATSGARRIVYVSCHPGTLARDAQRLVASGYELVAAQIFDMFPHTHHVETMAFFELA